MRCDGYTMSDGYKISRRMQCQQDMGHEGQCSYHRRGGQGGSIARWWGVNPRPVGWLDDLAHHQLLREIYRLRRLCDENELDWRVDATDPREQ